MILKPNLSWKQNQGIALPTVQASISVDKNALSVFFNVEEPQDCFVSEVTENNGRCWEDSCVEVFLRNPKNFAEYYNFEVTNRGFMLAALGKNRENRQNLSRFDIDKVVRNKQVVSAVGNLICWGMTIEIPASLLGIHDFTALPLLGNLYKCADKANTPHYLSAFPIDSEVPDFHRPEFFQDLRQLQH